MRTDLTSQLRLVRLPGEFGPVLRCRGELTVATAEPLRRELAMLVPMNHTILTVDVSRCRQVDAGGALTILEAFVEMPPPGRLAVVVGDGAVAQAFRELGVEGALPLFPTEAAVAMALRGDGSDPVAPESWREARAHTLARWRNIEVALEYGASPGLLRRITSQFGICAKAEEACRQERGDHGTRCCFCPLFEVSGGRSADIGCRSLLDPIIAAIREGDLDSAKAQIRSVINTVAEMPLPDGTDMPPTLARFRRH